MHQGQPEAGGEHSEEYIKQEALPLDLVCRRETSMADAGREKFEYRKG